ncbi:MAG: hypothetical protein AAGI72_23745 [Pseudomonadota bacterium]
MAVISPHQPITSWEDWRDTHRDQGRIPFPRKDGHIGDLLILRWYDCTAVDGLPLSALVEAAKTVNDDVWRIGIIWSATRPQDKYPIPALWASSDVIVRL